MLLFRIYLFCCLFFGLSVSCLFAQERGELAGVVHLRSGDSLAAQKIQHFWLIGRGGWLIVQDTLGAQHKIWDKDLDRYTHKGEHFISVLSGKKPQRNAAYALLVRQVRGRIELYGTWGARNDHIPHYYVRAGFYTGWVSERTFMKKLQPLMLQECAIFSERAAQLVKVDLLMQVEIFNRLCP